MSDGTPEAAAGTGLGDPSMEDILASIRRIIADDAPADLASAETRNEEDSVDLRSFAENPQTHEDQNKTLVEPAAPELIEVVDFDDILILDDDAFSSEDLNIPEANMFASDEGAGKDTLQLEAADITPVAVAPTDDDNGLDEDLFNLIENLGDDTLEDIAIPSAFEAPEAAEEPLVMPDVAIDDLSPIALLEADILGGADDFALETVAVDGADEALVAALPTDVETTHMDTSMADLSDDIDLLLDMDLTSDSGLDLSDNLIAEPSGDMSAEDETFAVLDIVESSLSDLSLDNFEAEPSAAIEMPVPVEVTLTPAPVITNAPFVDEPEVTPEAALDALSDDTLSIDEQQDDVIDLVAGLLADAPDLTQDDGVMADEEDIMATNLEREAEPLLDNSKIDEAFSALLEDEDDIASDVDIDLVKSLMADLTDEALMTDETDDTNIENMEPDETDVLDDILELSMADEEQMAEPDLEELIAVASELPALQYDSVHAVIDEPVFEAVVDPGVEDEAAVESVDSSINALLQIAAAAETDAREYENEPAVDVSPALETLDADAVAEAPQDLPETSMTEAETTDFTDEPLAVEALSFDMPEAVTEASDTEALDDEVKSGEAPTEVAAQLPDTDTVDTVELPSITQPLHVQQETPDMPQLVAKDGILDEVSQAASVEAFASLNSIVEEKTVFAESGPRIGDLVQEALRPMLKEWLDENLKGIVERAVSKEVKRIASGK